MTRVANALRIEAPVERVWEVLADITALPEWSPGVERCYLLTSIASGVGAVRFVDRGGRNYLKEEVVAWEPPRELTFRVIETNFPLRSSDIRFRIGGHEGATVVNLDVDYSLKYGMFGRLLDAIVVRRAYARGMRDLLSGLKRYVEGARQRADHAMDGPTPA